MIPSSGRGRGSSPSATSGLSPRRSRSWPSWGPVTDARMQARTHPSSPLFKLYIINEAEAFSGFYPVREDAVTLKGEEHTVDDLMGNDAVLFHHARTEDDA